MFNINPKTTREHRQKLSPAFQLLFQKMKKVTANTVS